MGKMLFLLLFIPGLCSAQPTSKTEEFKCSSKIIACQSMEDTFFDGYATPDSVVSCICSNADAPERTTLKKLYQSGYKLIQTVPTRKRPLYYLDKK